MTHSKTASRYDDPMDRVRRVRWPVVGGAALVGVALLVLSISLTLASPTSPPPRIVGPYDSQDGCEKCHVQEVEAWRASSHHGSLNLLHEHDEAPKIFSKLREAKAPGLGSTNDPRLAPRCARCHATTYVRPRQHRGIPMWGVSCESCHGPAERWVHGHGAYRVSGRLSVEEKRKRERPEDREARIAMAAMDGMVRTDDLMGLASNCLDCHIVDDPELIEVGGHPSQSPGFEFMSWTQGEVRHNFLRGSTNAPSGIERRRLMFLAGRLAVLNANVAALGEAKKSGGYSKSTIGRIEGAVDKLLDIADLFEDKGLDERLFDLLGLVYDEDEEEVLEAVRPGNAGEIAQLAQELRAQAAKLLTDLGKAKTSLAALDELMAKQEPKGKPHNATSGD